MLRWANAHRDRCLRAAREQSRVARGYVLRLVVDSSVLIAAARPAEPAHADARAFVERLRETLASGYASAFAPPELWLEVHVAERRLAPARGGPPLCSGIATLPIALVTPPGLPDLTRFLDELVDRTRGRRPFANATDLVYLWAAYHVGATVVTLDRGMLAYHGVVCDVTRPQHVRWP